jgi:molecular chaperone HtpG
MKQFKAESKRLLDLMINSIYTNKEIFLRELISNASDAMDKLHYESLTNKDIKISKDDLKINIDINKENRTITISDNGCGMDEKELENNLGTIAKSGSLAFKNENEKKEDIEIIGQFGVGFYSAFMVSDEVKVYSKKYGSDVAYSWTSKGVEGYSIEPYEKESFGTTIVLSIKPDSEEESYSEFLEEYKIKDMVKKYSDYIRYPIQMLCKEEKLKEGSKNEYETVETLITLNSMVPIWKKPKAKVTQEEYESFYREKFNDYEKPVKVIHSNVEGTCSYNTLLYIPSHEPYDYYTPNFKKGLQLYSNGVLIMDKCEELLPDYYCFVNGLVDSQDLSLNISREMLQHDRQLKVIAKSLDKKINTELLNLLKENREDYEKFYKAFGRQLKYGTYSNFGLNKESLQDLLLFYSSFTKKQTTLAEYVERMKEDQKTIYYACGESTDKIDMLPQVEMVKEKGYEILYLTDGIDEFVFQTMMNYKEKTFKNICSDNLDLDTQEEKDAIKKENDDNKDLLEIMKETLKDEIKDVRFTNKLKNHPVCLSSEGEISVEMEKVMNSMPSDQKIKAQLVLEINSNHPIAEKLKTLYKEDKDSVANYAKILFAQAKLIEGLSVENPTEISNLVCDLISK